MMEPLSLKHQAEIEQALASFKRGEGAQALSDYSFANFYLFRDAHQYRYAPGAYPCLVGVSYDGEAYLLPLFDVRHVSLPMLQALRTNLALPEAVLFPLAQAQVADLKPEQFDGHANRDDADYVYSADQFRHYQGSVLQKKRNLVRQLLSAHELTAQPYSAACIEGADAVLADWMRAKGKAAGEADERPCLEALRMADQLGLQGFFFTADGEPAGFVLAESLAPDVWVMRFAKGMDHLTGIYQYMFQHVCQATPSLNWLNFEQDLGLANLRQTKLSYQPTHLLSKYRLRFSQEAQDTSPAAV